MVEVTDEMVQRAYAAQERMIVASDRNGHEMLRYIFDAALNPPKPSPEIEVTEEMRAAGTAAMVAFEKSTARHIGRFWHDGVAEIYRAMKAKEPALTRVFRRCGPGVFGSHTSEDTRSGKERRVAPEGWVYVDRRLSRTKNRRKPEERKLREAPHIHVRKSDAPGVSHNIYTHRRATDGGKNG